MTHSQHEIIFSEFSRALDDSPRYGTVSIIVHFVDGEVSRIEKGKVESFQIEHHIEPVKLETKSESILPKPQDESPTRLLSKKEIASRLGLSLPTIHRYIAAGIIKVIRIGSRVLISTQELDRLMGKNPVDQ